MQIADKQAQQQAQHCVSPNTRFIACFAFCSYVGLPVKRDKVPNSRSNVAAHAVQVKRVSPGSTPYTATHPHLSAIDRYLRYAAVKENNAYSVDQTSRLLVKRRSQIGNMHKHTRGISNAAWLAWLL